MTATEIACLCIGAAGILTALLSLPFFCRGRALSKKCSARTTGTVQRYRIGGENRQSHAGAEQCHAYRTAKADRLFHEALLGIAGIVDHGHGTANGPERCGEFPAVAEHAGGVDVENIPL